MASAKSAKTKTSREASSVPGLILAAVSRHNKEDALSYRADGKWHNIPAAAFVERVKNVALGLAGLGVRPGDRIALLSENRPEWSIADLAILSLGAFNVPIYTTQALEQVDYILSDSGARAIFISTRRLYKHALPVIAERSLEHVILFDEEVAEDVEHGIGLEQLEQNGRELARQRPGAFEAYLQAVRSEDLATIIYTSGTTGEPKGVMLTHNNFTSNVIDCSDHLDFSSSDVVLSVLPLSHVFERGAMYMYLHHGAKVFFAEAIERIGDNMREVRPTVVVAVPRLFEKIYARIKDKAAEGGRVKTGVLTWAVSVAKR